MLSPAHLCLLVALLAIACVVASRPSREVRRCLSTKFLAAWIDGSTRPQATATALLCGAVALGAMLYLTGCAALDGYQRTYSVEYQSGDQRLGVDATFAPLPRHFSK